MLCSDPARIRRVAPLLSPLQGQRIRGVALNKAPLPIRFGGGVSLREDAKSVPTTRLIDLLNGVFEREIGRASCRERGESWAEQVQRIVEQEGRTGSCMT